MSAVPLRLYHGPSDAVDSVSPTPPHQAMAAVPLGEAIPLLADAYLSGRTWLKDFEDEELTMSADLYEVILTYQFYRRPSA